MKRLSWLALLIPLAACAGPTLNGPIEVDGGLVQGSVAEADPSIHVFKGIPFAAPPVGELRWRPPQPVEAWQGIHDAARDAPACLQPEIVPGIIYGPVWPDQSEDCLYLNIWTGAASPAERRPVMVWIHGGSLSRGTAAQYNGRNFAQKGVVLVVIQYRLNAFGFLAHPELTAESEHGSSGNYGLLDQIAALEWVQRNITKFGGDPNNVTIFGESAGSWSVCFQMATPLSKGLFHRGIGESGTAFFPLKPLASVSAAVETDTATATAADADAAASAEELGERFAEAMGAPTLAEMRAAPPDDIIEAQYDPERRAFNATRFDFRPAVDGWVVPDQVYNIYREGRQHKVPVILGYNRDETTVFAKYSAPKTVGGWEQTVRGMAGAFAGDVLAQYPAANDAEVWDAFCAAGRDRGNTWPKKTWARLMGKIGAPVWMYHFTRVPPGPQAEELGAYHAAEISYVFNGLGRSDRPYTEIDQAVADAMSSYWVNFAATGDPNGDGLPLWPAFAWEGDAYMDFGDTVEARTGLYPEAYELWDRIYSAQLGAGRGD